MQQWDQNTPAKALTDHIQNVAKNKDRILERHFENVYIFHPHWMVLILQTDFVKLNYTARPNYKFIR
jgi:hypothetical protein